MAHRIEWCWDQEMTMARAVPNVIPDLATSFLFIAFSLHAGGPHFCRPGGDGLRPGGPIWTGKLARGVDASQSCFGSWPTCVRLALGPVAVESARGRRTLAK